MSEKDAEKLFKKYKQKFIKHFGRQELDNHQIDEMGKSLFGNKYKGSFPQDEKFQLKPGFYILNTDVETGPGIH